MTEQMSGQMQRASASGRAYDVNYFATKHGLTRKQARDLISRIGNDRRKLTVAAVQLVRRRMSTI
jgi:hypothetical protein